MLSSTATVKDTDSKYPKMLRLPHNGLVVLFAKHGEGTVVCRSDSTYSIGYSKDSWDMNNFTTEVKSVTIISE